MKHLFIKTLIAGLLLTSAGQVFAFAVRNPSSCISVKSWLDDDSHCHAKFTNLGEGSVCSSVYFEPVLYEGPSNPYPMGPVTLSKGQEVSYWIQSNSGKCNAKVVNARTE